MRNSIGNINTNQIVIRSTNIMILQYRLFCSTVSGIKPDGV